jgi:2-oxoglutarate dehydrogenase E2 component (dihydrolipoamide succinyltransferase)
MIHDVRVPSPGESITEVVIAQWVVKEGEIVGIDQELAEVESDKATLPLLSPVSGRLKLLVADGATVAVGQVVCAVDDQFAENPKEKSAQTKPSDPSITKPSPESIPAQSLASPVVPAEKESNAINASPLAKAKMEAYGLSMEDVLNGLRRITSSDVDLAKEALTARPSTDSKPEMIQPERIRMSPLRKKIAARLVAVKNETAMLTTFNEVDMSAVMQLRKDYQQAFQTRHSIKLGFMSFFIKAVCEALHLHPNVNAMTDGEEIVRFSQADIGVAVQTPKGLMVPVLRAADRLSLAEIETKLAELADKARTNKISLDELSGGTFTITNGGVFGSLLSTPILNPPQAGILGMHNIVERPVAVHGKVEIRPMMYIALSYDHRLIDGKDSVGFLVRVKEMIEQPIKMLSRGEDPLKKLLDL